MKNYDYWKSFANTGKIDDYLHYIACTKEECADEFVPGVDSTRNNKERDREGGLRAGINYCNGDGSIGHASW